MLVAVVGGCSVAVPSPAPSPIASIPTEPTPSVGSLVAVTANPTPSAEPTSAPSAQPTPTAVSVPTPTAQAADGLQGFIADLQQAGASVRTIQIRSRMPPPALFTDSAVLCVNSERVSVYSFPTEEDRARVTAQIDPDDPSDLGDGSILWMGPPWYWERDRIVVVYVFGRPETQQLLTSILGEPFARARETGELPPADPC